jgi:diguanylate cyclase (GGDEF)-like protein
LIRLDAERYAFLAAHDSLTGLLNRGGFRDATATLISDANGGEPAAFMLIDLDGFKEINDMLGHPVGDQVLVEVAARLRATARENDFIARLGGDEFAIVCPGIGDEATVIALGLRFVATLAEPIMTGPPFSAKVSGSIGVSFAPLHGATFDEVFAHADRAMYAAKADGRNCVRIFRPVGGKISVTS